MSHKNAKDQPVTQTDQEAYQMDYLMGCNSLQLQAVGQRERLKERLLHAEEDTLS
jgi:hypothetical protein